MTTLSTSASISTTQVCFSPFVCTSSASHIEGHIFDYAQAHTRSANMRLNYSTMINDNFVYQRININDKINFHPIRVCARLHMFTYTRAYIHTYACTHTHTHARALTCTHTLTHTHTQIYTHTTGLIHMFTEEEYHSFSLFV